MKLKSRDASRFPTCMFAEMKSAALMLQTVSSPSKLKVTESSCCCAMSVHVATRILANPQALNEAKRRPRRGSSEIRKTRPMTMATSCVSGGTNIHRRETEKLSLKNMAPATMKLRKSRANRNTVTSNTVAGVVLPSLSRANSRVNRLG